MTSTVQNIDTWSRSPWRYAMWIMAAGLIGAALYAWELVRIGEYGFVIVAAIFAGVCLVVERAAGTQARWAYGAGLAIAILTALGQIWVNLAVGIIGSEDNPANLGFFLVSLAVLAGLPLLRKAPRLAWLMAFAAVAQVFAGVYGILAPAGPAEPPMSPPIGIILLLGYFVALWLNAAALFKVATALISRGSR